MGVKIQANELKTILDADVKHREMLFRRGYLLTDGSFDLDRYPFYGLWTRASFGRYSLLVQQKQTFYIQGSDGVSAAIIGHAYNPFDKTCDENKLCLDLIAAYQNGIPAFFDKVSEFTGLHVILLTDGEKLIACQDACGLTGCFFGKIKGVTCIAEHVQLIADLFSLSIDPYVEALLQSKCYNIGNRHLPGNKTSYAEIKRLGPNTYLRYDGAFSIRRFYPVAAHPEFQTEEEKAAMVERIGTLIHNGIECCSKKWDRCAISLSGGTDSKTTLSCANGLYDRFSYFSFHSKPQELVDAEGAQKICAKLGLTHTLYHIPEENDAFEDFALVKMILQHNTAYIKNLADNEVRKYIYLHDLNAYDIELKSESSEVARVFFERKYEIAMPKTLNERMCSIFQTRFWGHPRLLRWCDMEYYRFLREISLEKALFNFEHTDLIYWEIRMGCWGVSVISSQQLYHRVSIPMNNRKILELFLCFPHEERKSDSVHKRIMAFMNQNVLDAAVEIRNLYFHGYRIFLEKTFFRFRTAFYRTKNKPL